MNKIKLIAFDMDGTLLDSQKNPPKDFEEYVVSHPECKFVLASGRQVFKLEKDFYQLKDHLIFLGDNGSFCIKSDKMIFAKTMPLSLVKKSLEIVEKIPDLEIGLCGKETAYLSNDNLHVDEYAKYYARYKMVDNLSEVLNYDEISKLACFVKGWNSHEVINKIKGLPENISVVTSGAEWIDISIKGNDKGSGLRELMDILGINKQECMAFGDQMNDYEMLKSVAYPIVMKNGHEELKKIAYHITDTNDENGVMKVLYSIEKLI